MLLQASFGLLSLVYGGILGREFETHTHNSVFTDLSGFSNDRNKVYSQHNDLGADFFFLYEKPFSFDRINIIIFVKELLFHECMQDVSLCYFSF